MAEWLRRWTADLMRTLRAGSIPDTGDFFLFFFNDDDDGASRSGASKRKARALKRVQSTKPEGAKRPRMRMQMQSTKLEGPKRLRMQARSPREQSD